MHRPLLNGISVALLYRHWCMSIHVSLRTFQFVFFAVEVICHFFLGSYCGGGYERWC